MRFYDPDSGRVTIDGHDLKAVDPASLRRQMGVVLPDNYTFDASLRDNVRLGRPEATDEALREAIIAAGLEDYVMSLPEKEHTLLGEYGVQPPEEMIQRLAIAPWCATRCGRAYLFRQRQSGGKGQSL